MINDLFRWATLGVMVAFGYTVLTHSAETATVLGSVAGAYNGTLTTLEGR